MKKSAIAFILILSGLNLYGLDSIGSNENDQIASSKIQYYSVSNCNNWLWASVSSGTGYMCSSIPTRVNVPDAYSIVNAVNDLEKNLLAKIEALEAKIAELEKKSK